MRYRLFVSADKLKLAPGRDRLSLGELINLGIVLHRSGYIFSRTSKSKSSLCIAVLHSTKMKLRKSY